MMDAGKEVWIAEYERTCEWFEDGEISEDDFRGRLIELGYDTQEIDDHIYQIRVERGEEQL